MGILKYCNMRTLTKTEMEGTATGDWHSISTYQTMIEFNINILVSRSMYLLWFTHSPSEGDLMAIDTGGDLISIDTIPYNVVGRLVSI